MDANQRLRYKIEVNPNGSLAGVEKIIVEHDGPLPSHVRVGGIYFEDGRTGLNGGKPAIALPLAYEHVTNEDCEDVALGLANFIAKRTGEDQEISFCDFKGNQYPGFIVKPAQTDFNNKQYVVSAGIDNEGFGIMVIGRHDSKGVGVLKDYTLYLKSWLPSAAIKSDMCYIPGGILRPAEMLIPFSSPPSLDDLVGLADRFTSFAEAFSKLRYNLCELSVTCLKKGEANYEISYSTENNCALISRTFQLNNLLNKRIDDAVLSAFIRFVKTEGQEPAELHSK